MELLESNWLVGSDDGIYQYFIQFTLRINPSTWWQTSNSNKRHCAAGDKEGIFWHTEDRKEETVAQENMKLCQLQEILSHLSPTQMCIHIYSRQRYSDLEGSFVSWWKRILEIYGAAFTPDRCYVQNKYSTSSKQ